MLGSLILYLKGMRIMMFQLSAIRVTRRLALRVYCKGSDQSFKALGLSGEHCRV